jgi:hypothetical protein
MRHIRLLENRLDKANVKYNEATSIHKTYVLIAKRLREERIGFNTQVSHTPCARHSNCGRSARRARARR